MDGERDGIGEIIIREFMAPFGTLCLISQALILYIHLLALFQRQLEVYHLKPNETYDFQIWANNHIGPGDISTVSGTTRSQYGQDGM